MKTGSFGVRSAIGLALLVVFGTAQATVLTFADFQSSPGVPFIPYDDIPGSYGDAVTAVGGAPTGSYGMGDGWTPNIQTSYRSVDGAGGLKDSNLDYWSTGYGDLVDVAFSPTHGYFARIILTPDAGYSVTLNSFDLGGWPSSDLTADRIRVFDSSGMLFNMDGTLVLGAGGTHSSYSPSVTSSGALTIEWGASWNIGIDNVNFDQSLSPVPEPVTMALAAGALGLAARRRRK